MSAPSADAFVVDPVAPERLSMSFIRASEACLRRAHHEREADRAGGMALTGRAFHEVAATVGMACAMRGGGQPTPEEVERVARRVLANPEESGPFPKAAWDETLSLTARWARAAHFDPDEQFEVLSHQELAGRTLSARLDRLTVRDGVAVVRDYKTGWGKPEDQAGLPLQGQVYAWHAARLHPDVGRVVYTEDWVRFGIQTGPFELDPSDLERVEAFLLAAIERIDKAYAAGELPATPGSACSSPTRCPAVASCPVPGWARPETRVESEDDAIGELEQILVDEQRVADRKKAIRCWLEATGRRALVVNGEEIGWSDKPGSRLDEKAAKAAGFDPGAFRVETTPSFGRRKAR